LKNFVKRPIIRNDTAEEFLNKMTDDEIKEIEEELIKKGVPKKFPEWNSAYLAKIIDIGILYTIIKMTPTDEE